jgi:hypothetical protein
MANEKLYWTMKDGTKIDVDDMTESHLRNVLKLIIRRSSQATVIRHSNQTMPSCPHNIEQAMDLEPYAYDYLWKD